MLTRRKFLKGSLATLVLTPIMACSSDDDSPMGSGGTNDTSGGCQGITSTGSNSTGHAHTVCVPTSDLTSPPASGVTYTTSMNAGHTHTVNLNQSQLQTINGGGPVSVTSSGPGHTHTFMVEKA